MEVRIKAVMARVFKVDPALINKDTAPGTIEGWDSLAQMNLVAALEDEFGIEIDEAEYEQMVSYRVIVAIIGTYLED
jgi:acyl carrier protein